MPENTDGVQDSPITEVSIGRDRLSINPHGGLIEELILDGTKILTTVVRGDGKKASTHPCTPIFGPETTTSFGLPQHGPMRSSETEIRTKKDRVSIEYDVKGGSYPDGLNVRQSFRIRNGTFTLDTQHRNTSSQSLPVNFGEHLYWDSPEGWSGLKINGADVTELVEQNGVIDLLSENEILIPGKPPILLKQKGLTKAVLWAYKDGNGKVDESYVCIEPVEGDPLSDFFGKPESMIDPGTSRSTSLEISIKS